MSYLAARMILCLIGALAIGLVVGWLLRRFSALEREAVLRGEIDLRDERVGALEGQLGERDSRIVALGSDLNLLQARVPGLESTLAARDDQVMSLTMDIDTWKQQIPELESRLADAEAARVQLRADLAQQTSALQARDAEVMRLETELQRLSEQLATDSARAAQLSALQEEHDGLKLRSDALSREAHEREQALSELRASLQNQDAERASLAQRLTSLAPVAARVDSQDATIVSLNNDLRTRDTAIRSLREQISAMSSGPAGTDHHRSQALLSDSAGGAARPPAGRITATDERDWRARLRIAESARRRAEAQARRENEQVRRLEAQLRASTARPVPGEATALSGSPPQALDTDGDFSPRFLTSPPQDIDDLRQIIGVGNVMQQTLNALGIYQFRQVARFTEEDIAWIDDRLKFKGRIVRDNWIEQAAELHQLKYKTDPAAAPDYS